MNPDHWKTRSKSCKKNSFFNGRSYVELIYSIKDKRKILMRKFYLLSKDMKKFTGKARKARNTRRWGTNSNSKNSH